MHIAAAVVMSGLIPRMVSAADDRGVVLPGAAIVETCLIAVPISECTAARFVAAVSKPRACPVPT